LSREIVCKQTHWHRAAVGRHLDAAYLIYPTVTRTGWRFDASYSHIYVPGTCRATDRAVLDDGIE